MPYTHAWKVNLHEVDRSGLIFHSRALEAFHEAVEAMYDDASLSYHAMHDEFDVGTPVVHVEADFGAPVEYGDTVTIEVTPEFGERSIRYLGRGVGEDGADAFTVERVQATIDRVTREPIPVPQGLRELLRPYAADG